jgi:hypothetical protein
MEIKGHIFALPIKIQISGCCCLIEQVIKSILTIIMHLDFKEEIGRIQEKIFENIS